MCLFIGVFAYSQKQPPVAVDDAYATGLNSTLTVGAAQGVLTNDTDPNGTGGLSVDPNPQTNPGNGSLTLNADGSFTYVPNPGFSGSDAFSYRVCDDGNPYEVVSRFDFDTPALDQATVGPNATSVNPLAAQTGCGIRIASGSGGSTGIDVMIPNTGGIFDFISFVVDFE